MYIYTPPINRVAANQYARGSNVNNTCATDWCEAQNEPAHVHGDNRYILGVLTTAGVLSAAPARRLWPL
jgi:hypothetical protein